MNKASKKPDVRDRAKRVMELFGGTKENAGFLKVNFSYDTVADKIAAVIKAEKRPLYDRVSRVEYVQTG